MIALSQHPRVHRTVRPVAGRATLPHGFVLEDEWTALRDVAFAARFLLRRKRRTAANDGLPLVWVVTIGATDSSAH